MSFEQYTYTGYTTKEALLQLKTEIEEIIEAREEIHNKSSFLSKFRHSLIHHSCQKSIYHWTDFFCGCLSAFCLLIGYLNIGEHVNNIGLVIEVFIIAFVVFANGFITCREDAMRRFEVLKYLETILDEVQDIAYESVWYPYNYLNLNCPISPSVTVIWAFRDGELVNLPVSLIVKGDLLLLRPGQTVPVRCNCVEDSDDSCYTYEYGDIFLPNLESEDISSPKQHAALQPRVYCADETVFTSKIRNILDAGMDRPSSLLQNEIYTVKTKIIYLIILPATILVVLITNLWKYFYWPLYSGHWSEIVFILPVQAILPMIIIIFPPIYHILNWFGTARLHLLSERSLHQGERQETCLSDDSGDDVEQWHVKLKCCEVISEMKRIAVGQNAAPCRSVDLVHVLGSVTAICCLDKKGILSWPIPTPEKTFLLTARNQTAHAEPSHQVLTAIKEAGESDDDLELPVEFNRDAAVEVLDISHDPKNPYGIIFDDPNWRRHINSLKPLGLNILLNTCNLTMADAYTQFADHVSTAAHGRADAVAVVNRRCLCELPRQIGFSDQALDNFELQFDICMYKNVDDAHTRSKHLHKSFIKHKTPMPNMMSVVVRDLHTGAQQLMTQGTADIMLDLCSDYWNGTDLVPLLDLDRKRILDFYHRQSISAYCTAFSYSPVIDKLSHKLGETYIQLPAGAFYAYPDFSSPTTVRSFDLESLDKKIRRSVDRRFSADSAIGRPEPVVSDMEGCIKSQCNQIFIGMVTMQYQVMSDIVQIIEQLENACIRFVYFSSENELRSRIFSEKMGLESGWNCHISLLSEHDDSSSHSSSHGDQGKRNSTKRTLSNSSSRHCSSHSIVRDLSPRRTTEEEEARMELLGQKSSKTDLNEDGLPDVRIRHDSHTSSIERPLDEGIHCSTSMISSQSTDSIVLDSQNRAKLPKGIENIRPHLQNVDNVPLLVSLFTDCTAETTNEMVRIMQENGEVVCVIGSTANIDNIDTFLQADACIGLEPVYPNVCTRQPPVLELLDNKFSSPMELSNKLNSLPCSLSFHRQANVDLRSLILEARAHTLLLRNCLQFYLCCCLAVTLLQMIASVLLLPPVLSTRHVIWLTIIVIPVLSVSLVWHSTPDENLATMATGKNRRARMSVIVDFTIYALIRFVPSILICILCFGVNLYCLCEQIPNSDCHLWWGNRNATASGPWSGWYGLGQRLGFCMAQNFALFQMVVYLIVVSISFVHRNRLLRSRPPFDNLCWVIAVPVLCVIQIIFSVFDLVLMDLHSNDTSKMADIPLATWLVAFLWLGVLAGKSELIKLQEIRSSVRYQKRAKLDFGTKLGMNSPF